MGMRRGFTIIEVLLFLSITMLLMAGMFIGTNTNIERERYADSVESVRAFLQEQYEYVANPMGLRDRPTGNTALGACLVQKNDNGALVNIDTAPVTIGSVAYTTTSPTEEGVWRGRSHCLIYGRLIEFTSNQAGEPVLLASSVVGLDLESIALSNHDTLYLNSLMTKTDLTLLAEARLGRAADTSTFLVPWEATVSGLNRSNNSLQTPAGGAILIVRTPLSGSVRTFILDSGNTCGLDELGACTEQFRPADNRILESTLANRYFCVLEGQGNRRFAEQRRVVRVRGNIGNSTGVDILPLDTAADDEGEVVRCPNT